MIRINNTQYFHFLHQANILRRSGSLCDAIISVRSQTFRAHRLVLACASRRLAQQLSRGDIDSPVHCTLEFFSPHTFQQVLDFTYTETLEVSVDDLHLLLRAAQLLEMQLLEEQCRKQLDNLQYRAREERKEREVSLVKEEKESAEQADKTREEKVKEVSPGEDQARSSVTAGSSASDNAEDDTSPPAPVKKPRLLPVSAAASSRETVIASSNDSSSLPPWILHSNMWNSVNTLRWMAENYSNLVGAHPLDSQSESSAGHTLPFRSPHMLYLGRHFPSSVMGYPSLHPRYTPNLYVGSPGVQSLIKQSLGKRKRQSQTAFTRNAQTGEPSHQDVPKASAARLKDCQHCRARLDGDPQKSASAPAGEACVGCRFCGRGETVQNESHSRRQDHLGEKPYQCQYCTKKFSLKHQLDTHHRVHTGEKPFECRICGQRSRDYSAMIKHLRTHGGAAPYQCTVCREFCNSLVAMQRHVKSHSVQDFPPNWSINSTYLYTSDL